ncbi:hypothetical protein CXG81DRAFT_13599 [Caulochytrium protostelioides]|uniref:Ribosomal protein L32e n=1 Tax=Caulochytrium protostelioides TaxID=1555241 RepID=A0A4P9X4X7_9FUNG|nr:hypothetical protein CXG81DRAFT_13599 [Caulochytrium protostelioides]|eukprot:RKP00125.1 hypothetical protein CXG81DRAFT_13599 [Caulochytrium protostelioides]
MPTALPHPAIVHKRTTKFKRHHSDRYNRVGESWRRPKGIDNRVRRRFKGQLPMPNCGYGSDKRTKFMLSNGFRPFLIKNAGDLEVLLMHNRSYAAVFAHGLSAPTRAKLLKRAGELDVKVMNANARVRKVEHE